MVTDLRTDLGLGEVPFVAGKLLHNPLLRKLPYETASQS
jgi:hypothetical protein